MHFFKMVVAAGFISLVAASPALALGGGGGRSDAQVTRGPGGAISGTFEGGTFTGTCDASGHCTGSYVVTSEPLALFAVGLGLLGARLLRRR